MGFLFALAFLIVASYLWYLYFHNYEKDVLTKETILDLEILNSGKIDYVNAKVDDPKDIIPVYYFRIKNNTSNDVSYKVLMRDVSSVEANDGCSDGRLFKREELKYELLLKGRVVASGLLSDIKNNILTMGNVNGNSINDYSMRVWLNDEEGMNVNTIGKHYHYVVDVKVD